MKKFISLVAASLVSVCAFANPGFSKVQPVAHTYTVCVYAPEGLEPAFVGLENQTFMNTSMIPNIDEKGNLYYYAQFKAKEGSEIRFVASADQNNQIKHYDQTNQCWMDLATVTLGSDSVAVFNYSDASSYMWASVLENIQSIEAELQAARTVPVSNAMPDNFVVKYGHAYNMDGKEIQ